MKKVLGFVLMILGILTAVLGGMFILGFQIYDVIVNFETITPKELVIDIMFMVFKDIIAIVVGIFLITFGKSLATS